MRRLKKTDIRLNEALPWSLFDSRGTLLLRAGTVLSNSMHIDTLLERGIYIVETDEGTRQAGARGPRVEPFKELLALPLKLKPIFNALLSSDAGEDIPERIDYLKGLVQSLCQQDPDAALASVHINSHSGYLLSHHIHVAVLTALVAPSAELDEGTTGSLICAALTFDMAMHLNAYVEKTMGPIEDTMFGQVTNHPGVAYRFLRMAGIEDPIWLDAVLHHHERFDASGYPNGLTGDTLSPGAALLGLADSYCSAIKDRPYRKASTPRATLAALLQDRRYDTALVRRLTQVVTAFPPGTLARLANGEVAAIKSRPGNNTGHIAYAVFNPHGVPQLRPLVRDTRQPEFAIKTAVADEDFRAAEVVIRRIWNQA